MQPQSQPLPPEHILTRLPTADDWSRCRAIARQHGRSFYLASSLLPASRRDAVLSAYAYCRIADDIVDEASEQGREAALEALRGWTRQLDEPRDPVAVAFANTRRTYNIPAKPILDLLLGVEMDLTTTRYRDWDELHRYCYHVAGTVGLIVAPIFGCMDPSALHHASDLGIAMQLTNILRDIREDAEMGRLYLPLDEMEAFGVDPDAVLAGRPGGRFAELLAYQIARARALYASASKGIPSLTPSGRLATLAASKLYARILDEIEAMDYDVFASRAYVGTQGKVVSLSRATARFVLMTPYRRPRAQLYEVATPALPLQAPAHPWQQNTDRAS